jgi:hypothetical protein
MSYPATSSLAADSRVARGMKAQLESDRVEYELNPLGRLSIAFES